jgi:hypothetical protein
MTVVQDPQVSEDNPSAGNGAQKTIDTTSTQVQTDTGAAVKDQQTTPAAERATKETPRWIYQLSGDLQKDERLSGLGTMDELAKAYLEYAGKADRLIEIPGEDDAEGRAELFKRLGRPETPDGYEFTGVEIPELISDEELKTFRTLAHELGLNKVQAQKLLEHSIADLNGMNEQVTSQQKAEEEQKAAEKQKKIETLESKYGDNFAEVVTKAHRAYEAVGSKEFGEYLDSNGLGDDPVMVDAFLAIYEKIGEDTLFGSSRSGSAGETDWYPNTTFD